MLSIGISIHKHLEVYFKNNPEHITPEQKDFFLKMGKLFDHLGNEAYRMNANSLVKKTKKYFLLPDRNRMIANDEKQLKTWNTISKWNDFLFSTPVDNYIRPIHEKMKKLDIRNLEGLVSQVGSDPEKVKHLTNLIKQLSTNEEQPDSNIIITETHPQQIVFDCLNKVCTNSLLSYHSPILKCPLCGYSNTKWNKPT